MVRGANSANSSNFWVNHDTTIWTLTSHNYHARPCSGPAPGPMMPPRMLFRACRTRPTPSVIWVRHLPHRRFASSSAAAPEVYDVVCVGGGPAGLSLLTGLKASPITSGLKVALIEGQDLHKNRLPKEASLDSFSNRCSSLTPASVRNLQGREWQPHVLSATLTLSRHWSLVARQCRPRPTIPGDAGMGWSH